MSRSRKVRVKDHPSRPRFRRRSEPRPGEAAAHPEAGQVGRSHLPYREAGHVYEQDAAGESLGDPRDQIPGGAAEEKKDGLAIRVVGDRPQRLEELRQPLDFVEDDETFPAAQHPLRRAGQSLADGGTFEIEDGGRAAR